MRLVRLALATGAVVVGVAVSAVDGSSTSDVSDVDGSSSDVLCAPPDNGIGSGACTNYMKDRMCRLVTFNPDLTPEANEIGRPMTDVGAIDVGFIGVFKGEESKCETSTTMGLLAALDRIKELDLGFTLNPFFADSVGIETGGIAASWCLHQLNVPVFLGPSYSGAATAAGTVGKILEIPIMGTTATSASLANKEKRTGFGTLLRVAPSDVTQSRGLVALARTFGWDSVVLVHMANDEYTSGIAQEFRASAADLGVKITNTFSFNRAERSDKKYKEIVEKIKDCLEGTRVVLLVVYITDAKAILKIAKDMEMDEGWAWMGTDAWMSQIMPGTCGSTGEGPDEYRIPNYAAGAVGLVPQVVESNEEYGHLLKLYNARKGPDLNQKQLSWVDKKPNWSTVYAYDATLSLFRALYAYVRDYIKLREVDNVWLDPVDRDGLLDSLDDYPKLTLGKGELEDIVADLTGVEGRRDLLQYMLDVSFEGASGSIQFSNDTGERIDAMYDVVNVPNTTNFDTNITDEEYESYELVKIGTAQRVGSGTYELDKANVTVQLFGPYAIFPGNALEPPASSAYECEIDVLDESDKAIGYLSCFIGMMLSYCLAVFNVIYHDNKIVRVSSWRINLITIFGSFLLYLALNSFTIEGNELYQCTGVGLRKPVEVSNVTTLVPRNDSEMLVLFSTARPAVERSGLFDYPELENGDGKCFVGDEQCLEAVGNTICASRWWLLGVGFTLMFGSLFAKTYRISKLFSGLANRPKIGDHHVMGYIALLVTPMLIFLSVWGSVFPHKGAFYETPTDDTLSYVVRESCAGGEHYEIFILIFGFYLLSLLVLGAYLAWSVKDVWIKEVNDSNEVAVSIYTIVIVGGLGLVIALVLDDRKNQFLASNFAVWLSTTLVLCILYVPKVREVWRHRRDEDITLKTGVSRIGIHEAERMRTTSLAYDENNSVRRRRGGDEQRNSENSVGGRGGGGEGGRASKLFRRLSNRRRVGENGVGGGGNDLGGKQEPGVRGSLEHRNARFKEPYSIEDTANQGTPEIVVSSGLASTK